MQNNCNYSDNWQPYIGDYDKFEYDVKLEDGTIVENCYPNARKFNSISDLHNSQSFEESRVVEIRFSQYPRHGMNGKVSNAPQYEWMESQKTDPILESKVYHIFNNHIPYYLPKSKASHGTVISVRTEPKVGRNQICPCGSGLKSKRCLHSQNITVKTRTKMNTEPKTSTAPDLSNTVLAEGFIVAKAFEIDLDKLDEGYLTDSIICYAENQSKAKNELLKMVRYDSWKLKYSGEELTYLNIPVKRRKSSDKIIFEGSEVVRVSIDSIKHERFRIAKLDEIANNPNIKYCYIIKGSYYRPNHCGYTSLRFEAGIYPKDEAVQHAKSVREIRLEWVDIEEHNKMINQKIAELQGRLL